MRKIASLLMAVVIVATTTFGQGKQQKKSEKAQSAQPAPKLKKDGTPDKRFKQVKDTTVVRKKDGSPDMRFKKNKRS